jgi:hypothetical protein
MTGQRLPQAYRSRPRPSSALSAKASTVCPCSLDQKNTGKNRCRYGVFKVRAGDARRQKEAGTRPVFQNSAAYEWNVEVDVILGELNSRTEVNFHQRVQRLPE